MFARNDHMPQGSRLSLRVAVVGGVGMVLFAVLFFRLWNLQVLSGDEYLAEAKNNRTREFKQIAPRGDILDRNGEVLVDNRTSLALQLNPQKLPEDPAEERAELARLGELAHMTLRKVRRTIAEGEEVAAGAPVTLRRDVGFDLVAYVEENQDEFPGVAVQRVFVRHYPDGTRAAHILGSVGEIEEDELKEPQYKGLEPGDEIGQAGAEYAYDKFLRGQSGLTRIQVNALGQPTPGGQLVSTPPTPGDSLKLTIDGDVQSAGEAGLAARGLPGAFISMNIDNGQILAMGSNPTFDPSDLIEPTQAQVDELYRDEVLAPLVNRATEGAYPTGSIFKIITALAALENGVITTDEVIQDGGQIEVGGETFENAGGVAHGPVELRRALQVSSDVYFYLLGLDMWKTNDLQKEAHELGIGRPAGLDLPEEGETLLPSKAWRNQLFKEGLIDRPWSSGDNIQLATGQGDLQTNPLQMALAYAALGNGGKIVTPHVGLEVEDAAGRVLKEFDFKPQRQVHIDPGYRTAILEGLHAAAQEGDGTAASVFGGFPIDIAGKTGTAERPGHGDQSWFAALSPYPNPRIVTIATVEEGGFGAESAAPVVLDILEAIYDKQAAAVSSAGGAE
ncbi:MAG TPA: penicillin-binding protein 2 [Solirubrobacterales bacterium]|jgi:penicillin-binding protein 2|nr:penicillin-binding protein 2 [Solirubrobacterales bacterium]